MPPDKISASTRRVVAARAAGYCEYCRSKTRGTDPDTGEQVTLFHPRQQRRQDHFEWNEDNTLIVGMAACGRATVASLKLDRSGLVNLRNVLVQVGLHPP
ncbi:MAG: hypothetical protein NW224_30440 [Leptolyngbyaceae cyanobacterium bins.302]|nr:hypothetical protein [Leptolyngbyaceae cyanobacterium bins.302]